MTLIIDIPDEDYDKIKDNSPDAFNYLTSWRLYDAIKNGTQLFDNPTNGDMIKAIFPNMIDSCWERKKYLSDVCGDYTAIEYTENWWNAPYKGVNRCFT